MCQRQLQENESDLWFVIIRIRSQYSVPIRILFTSLANIVCGSERSPEKKMKVSLYKYRIIIMMKGKMAEHQKLEQKR